MTGRIYEATGCITTAVTTDSKAPSGAKVAVCFQLSLNDESNEINLQKQEQTSVKTDC